MSDRIKRVLMTGDTVGGVWTFTMELAASLSERNVEVTLASLGGCPSKAQVAEAAEIPRLRLLTSEWKLEWMDDPWADVEESGRWLIRCEKQYEPDVVHLNSFSHGALPWRTPVVLTAHSCVASWWSAVKGESLPETWSRYRVKVERSLHAANVITAPSTAMLSTLHENYGVDLDSDRCRAIPNGRRAGLFHRGAKEPFILSAGRLWDEAKNVAAVAKAAMKLAWPVYVAGEQKSPAGAELSVEGCRMLGKLSTDQLADWYARAAIYVSPARYEPFGLSVLEAAMSGCALVLGDIPSLRELWRDAAIFVPPEDATCLADVCRALMEDHSRREDLAQHGFERAQTFTPEKMANAYLDTYCLAMNERYACAS
jgi:glycosyltransferase involved in cell wall biosynthesis